MHLVFNKAVYFFVFIFSFIALYAREDFLNSSSNQNWETGKIDSIISLDVEKTGLKLPSGRNEAFQIVERYIPSKLKDIYLSIIVDSSHRLGNYLAENKVSLNSINSIIESGERTPPYFSHDLK